VSLALLCAVLALALTTVSAQYGSGFAVVSGKSLWTYGDPSSLDMWLANKVQLSLTANAVSAAAGSPYGGFVVAAPSQLLSYNVTQWVGDELTGQLISDLAFVPRANNNTVVAFGVERGVFSNSALFLRSLDGGLTRDRRHSGHHRSHRLGLHRLLSAGQLRYRRNRRRYLQDVRWRRHVDQRVLGLHHHHHQGRGL